MVKRKKKGKYLLLLISIAVVLFVIDFLTTPLISYKLENIMLIQFDVIIRKIFKTNDKLLPADLNDLITEDSFARHSNIKLIECSELGIPTKRKSYIAYNKKYNHQSRDWILFRAC